MIWPRRSANFRDLVKHGEQKSATPLVRAGKRWQPSLRVLDLKNCTFSNDLKSGDISYDLASQFCRISKRQIRHGVAILG